MKMLLLGISSSFYKIKLLNGGVAMKDEKQEEKRPEKKIVVGKTGNKGKLYNLIARDIVFPTY